MKKQVIKESIVMLTAACLATGMIGCGSNSGTTASATQSESDTTTGETASSATESSASQDVQTDTNEPVTIKFANYALLEDAYTDFWNGVKEGFEKEHPNVTIEWVTAPYGEITSQVITMAGAGDKCDIVFGENSWISTFEDAGFAVPVSDVLGEDYLSNFYDNALESCSIEGTAYGVPMYVSPFIIYYNTDIFEQAGIENPPATYDELLVDCKKIDGMKTTDGNVIYPFGQTTASVPISGTSVNSMIYNFGGQVLDEEGNLSIDNDGFHEAIEMLKTLDDNGYNPQNSKLKDLRNLFALGQLAMYYDQSWGISGVKAINPDAESFTKSAIPMKGGSGNGASILSASVLIFADNGDARREATKELVEYIMSDDILGDYLTNIVPAYPSLKTMSQPDSAVLEGAADSIGTAIAAPSVPQLNDLNLELDTLAQAVTVSDEDVDTAIEEFRTSAEALLQ